MKPSNSNVATCHSSDSTQGNTLTTDDNVRSRQRLEEVTADDPPIPPHGILGTDEHGQDRKKNAANKKCEPNSHAAEANSHKPENTRGNESKGMTCLCEGDFKGQSRTSGSVVIDIDGIENNLTESPNVASNNNFSSISPEASSTFTPAAYPVEAELAPTSCEAIIMSQQVQPSSAVYDAIAVPPEQNGRSGQYFPTNPNANSEQRGPRWMQCHIFVVIGVVLLLVATASTIGALVTVQIYAKNEESVGSSLEPIDFPADGLSTEVPIVKSTKSSNEIEVLPDETEPKATSGNVSNTSISTPTVSSSPSVFMQYNMSRITTAVPFSMISTLSDSIVTVTNPPGKSTENSNIFQEIKTTSNATLSANDPTVQATTSREPHVSTISSTSPLPSLSTPALTTTPTIAEQPVSTTKRATSLVTTTFPTKGTLASSTASRKNHLSTISSTSPPPSLSTLKQTAATTKLILPTTAETMVNPATVIDTTTTSTRQPSTPVASSTSTLQEPVESTSKSTSSQQSTTTAELSAVTQHFTTPVSMHPETIAPQIISSNAEPNLYFWGDSNCFGENFDDWVTVPTLSNEHVIDASAGDSYSIILLQDGTARSAGYIETFENDYGQLGVNNVNEGTNPFRNISTVFDTEIGTFVDAPPFKRVFAGFDQSFLIDVDGQVWASGRNAEGNLCLGDQDDRRYPSKIPLDGEIVSIAIGMDHALLLHENGTVLGCGSNEFGQIGLRRVESVSIPTEITGLPAFVESVSAGEDYSLFVSPSGLHVTGSNRYGNLCDGNTGGMYRNPITFTSIDRESVMSFQASRMSSYILFHNGSVVSCGKNIDGRLGDGTYENNAFTAPLTSQAVKQLGLGPTSESLFLVYEDGTMFSAGLNEYGQLGVGDTRKRNVPTRVEFPKDVVIELLTAGHDHTLAMSEGLSFSRIRH